MARGKKSPEFEIDVDGEPYVWRLQRRPHWSHVVAERHGMAIAVRHREGQREAVLEFPPQDRPRFGAPQLQGSQIPPTLVAKAIAASIAAGWEPLSRGKPVIIVLNDQGN